MRLAFFATAALVFTSDALHAQAIVPTDAYRAARIPVGTLVSNAESPQLVVEASADGWVYVSQLSREAKPSSNLRLMQQANRMILDGRELHQWTAVAREALQRPDSAKLPISVPVLGHGNTELRLVVFGPARTSGSITTGCRSASTYMMVDRHVFIDFIELLEKAAVASGLGEPRLPALSRPYYSNEVGCVAVPSPSQTLPNVPAKFRGSPPTVGTTFIVDTTGHVEAKSIRFFADVDPIIESAVRKAVATWTYQPAEWDGLLVRQVVQTVVSFPTSISATTQLLGGATPLSVSPTNDGWVRLEGYDAADRPMREFYRPDEVDAWLRAIASTTRAPSQPASVALGASIGASIGSLLTATYHRTNGAVAFQLTGTDCAREAYYRMVDQPSLRSALARASRMARERHGAPTEATNRLFDASEVSCPASLIWEQVSTPGSGDAWHYPTASSPIAMADSNARVEAMVSFVVDTTGAPDASTLRIADGNDPRVASALSDAIKALRFRPASRAGQHVAQRVFHVVRFEPGTR